MTPRTLNILLIPALLLCARPARAERLFHNRSSAQVKLVFKTATVQDGLITMALHPEGKAVSDARSWTGAPAGYLAPSITPVPTTYEVGQHAFHNYVVELPSGATLAFRSVLADKKPGTSNQMVFKVVADHLPAPEDQAFMAPGLWVTYDAHPDLDGNLMESLNHEGVESKDERPESGPFHLAAPTSLDSSLSLVDPLPKGCCVIL
jgi:hypothetical protein